MKYSVIIATYNRATELADTLGGLAKVRSSEPWEVIVADNNSSDNTREVVERAAATFPVPLRYLFESQQGKAAALNSAIRTAGGEILMFTDDDALVEADWLDRAGAALRETDSAYVGGRVLPRWQSTPPRWLPKHRTRLWAVVALLDYGETRREFGRGIGWPLGVNMAVRADVFHVHGMWWDNRYDRVGNTLRGQGQREWCLRMRAAGLNGFYAPDMTVHHLVPAERLVKRYFRDWFYWFGISRAILYAHRGLDMEAPDEQTFDFSNVPHIAGVPRYMFRGALYHVREAFRHALRGRPAESFEHELMLCFFAGVVRQRWADRQIPVGSSSAARPAVVHSVIPRRG
jgi:glycosyltransferase involved in cell wall biosynthesis